MDGSQLPSGGRLASSDLAGTASRFLEEEFGDDVIALFLIGAAGDLAPSLKAQFRYISKDGHIRIDDLGEQGFIIAQMLGKRLGAEALRVAKQMPCQNQGRSVEIKKLMV